MERADLETTADNACFGCRPANPFGLKLRFARAGDGVEADFRAEPRHEGWPGRLHSGVLYAALLETANWTVWGLRERVGVPARTSALDLRRWIPTGTVLRLEGRLARPADPPAVEVVARLGGDVVARLERDFDLLDRAAFLARLGYAEVPAAFEDAFPA